jgi:multidrug efflux pump subunit AcrB
MAHHTGEPGRARRLFHRVLRRAMTYRWITIGLTVAAFGLSIWAMRFVEQQFFPNSDRPELIVDFALPQNAAISETAAEMDRLEAHLEDNENVLFWSSYVGRGAPRFLLAYDVPTPGPNTGQIVIQTPSVEARDALIQEYKKVVEFGVPEWGLAALFHIAEAFKDSVDKLLAAPIPVKVAGYKLTPDDKKQLRDQLKAMTPEIEEQAVEAYRLCVNKANELGVYNKWSNRARKRLQELRPEEYQPVEEEIVDVQFDDALTVARNSVIVREGDTWRSLGVEVAENGARPSAATVKGKEKVKEEKPASTEEKRKGKRKGGKRDRRGGAQ